MVQQDVFDDVHRASDTKTRFMKSKFSTSEWTAQKPLNVPHIESPQSGQMNSKRCKYFFLILQKATELNMWPNYINTTVSNIGGLRFIWSDSPFKINKFKHFNKSLKLSTVDSFAFIWDGKKKKKIAWVYGNPHQRGMDADSRGIAAQVSSFWRVHVNPKVQKSITGASQACVTERLWCFIEERL